jgi:hypothetical protein
LQRHDHVRGHVGRLNLFLDVELDPVQEGMGGEASVIGEASWYFRNDVGNSNLHWIKINVEKQVETANMPSDVIVALQYYRYW